MEFRDNNHNLVRAGERYAVGRGAKVARGTPLNQGTIEVDDNGRYSLYTRDNRRLDLGLPGEQDASGERATLTFIALDFAWNEIVDDCDSLSKRVSTILSEVNSRRFDREVEANKDIDAILALVDDRDGLSGNDIDSIHDFVRDGRSKKEVEAILCRESVDA